MKTIIGITLCFLSFNLFAATNLIVNPDAESVPTSSGWTFAAGGTDYCYPSSGGGRVLENQGGFPVAKMGSYLFYVGCNSDGELYQDINVSGNAISIDAGLQKFTFSGYTQSYNQSGTDGAQIIVEYRSASNAVLASYNTGITYNTHGWV